MCGHGDDVTLSLRMLNADDVLDRPARAARAAAGQVRRVLLEPARRHRHRPGADGDPVRRSHGASRPRHLRHRRTRQRARSTISKRTSIASCARPSARKLQLPGSRDEMRDIIIRTAAASGRRDGSIRYWLSSGPGSLELSPGRRRRARLLRDGLRRPLVSRAVVHRRPAGDDHDLSDQAAALRHHQDAPTTCRTC